MIKLKENYPWLKQILTKLIIYIKNVFYNKKLIKIKIRPQCEKVNPLLVYKIYNLRLKIYYKNMLIK